MSSSITQNIYFVLKIPLSWCGPFNKCIAITCVAGTIMIEPSSRPTTNRLCCGKYVLAVILTIFSFGSFNWSKIPIDGGSNALQASNKLVEKLALTTEIN